MPQFYQTFSADNPTYSSGGVVAGQSTSQSSTQSQSQTQQQQQQKKAVAVVNQGPSLAEQVAANLAALGYTNSPLIAGTNAPTRVAMQQPQGSNTLTILLILGALIFVIWYLKKHGEL